MTTPTTPAADLHDLIMNLPCAKGPYSESGINARLAYKTGHRDARHAAAELATARESALVAERDAYKAMVEDVSTEVHLLRAALVYIAEESDDMVALKCAQDALAAPAVEG